MLTHLSIRGLAVMASLDIDFGAQFNVITGETGAGKSILIKALGLLLGQKSSVEVIRSGHDDAQISGHFDLPDDHEAIDLLSSLGVSTNEGQVLIRRKITRKSRSQAWVNDTPVTLNSLRQLGESLIDIFGQHENLKLFNPNEHVRYLDQFVENPDLSAEVSQAYRMIVGRFKQLKTDIDKVSAKLNEKDYLCFRLKELQEFHPAVSDYQECIQLCHRASNLQRYENNLAQIKQLIEPEEGMAPARALWEISKLAGAEPSLELVGTEAAEIANRIDELSFQMARLGEQDELSAEQIEQAQSRLAGYQDFFRKFGVADVNELCGVTDRLQAELDYIESASEKIEKTITELYQAVRQLDNRANELSLARKKAVKSIKARLEHELKELAMPGSKFDIRFTSIGKAMASFECSFVEAASRKRLDEICEVLTAVSDTGKERVQFLLASNPGEPLMALDKIASGGEISRIMLALKRVLAAGAGSCLLVFDEIDTGISGQVADIVGSKLRELADSFQILCISHLAQVAAYADHHLKVRKVTKAKRTESQIVSLGPKESLEEIARLLSGREVTKQSLDNARALRKKIESSGRI